jgi:hypothetical protein
LLSSAAAAAKASAPPAAQGPGPLLTAHNGLIVDQDGKEVVFHGLGW